MILDDGGQTPRRLDYWCKGDVFDAVHLHDHARLAELIGGGSGESGGSGGGAATTTLAVTGKPKLPAGWTAEADADGKTYYHNTETGVTQWEEPLPDGWAAQQDESGNTFYVCARRGSSQWEHPANGGGERGGER